jgi:dipeptidyl aminopeptidase/acylaminoacyl peptidase
MLKGTPMKRTAVLLACLLAVAPFAPAADAKKRPMTVADLLQFKRVSDPQISPDGKLVAYVVGTVDRDKNTVLSSIWVASTDGKGEPRQLTNVPGKNDRHPRWSPDGKRLLFESNRGGSYQLWLIGHDGGEAKQLTTLSTEANNGIWSRDRKQIAFVSAVCPEFSELPFKESDAKNKQKAEEAEKSPVKARVFKRLFFRHWDSYVEDKRQHLFVIPAEGGEPKDVTPGDRDAFPTSTTFETGDNFTFSPDGKYLVFTAVPEKDEAWSTNYDLCRVPVTGGTTKWECLTKGNPAADSGPRLSPDGKLLAYRAQKKPGYEADLWELMVVEVDEGGACKGKPRGLTGKSDLAVDDFVWWENQKLYFIAEKAGATAIFGVGVQGGEVSGPSPQGAVGSLSASPKAGLIAYTQAFLNQPPEVMVGDPPRPPEYGARNVSKANAGLLAELDLPGPESVTVKGAGGTPMQMWILKPPGFDPNKKWPLAYLVHGGPQGAWNDAWSYRWNPQLWAAQGYVVALPNPRGSTGFGQKYVDEISADWGGKCYDDLVAGLEYLEKLPYIDADRMAAAGASFGGYMMNWFAVNEIAKKFKCLITHCSVWNLESMYPTTDELWFDEWEHGGPPWGKNRHSYEKHSPHRFAGNLGKYKTPMLVIHNDLDFRCPIGQGHELFTTLQRQGVPSRMVNFPDEGHWVLKPRNSEYWHKEVFAWLTKYAPPGGK